MYPVKLSMQENPRRLRALSLYGNCDDLDKFDRMLALLLRHSRCRADLPTPLSILVINRNAVDVILSLDREFIFYFIYLYILYILFFTFTCFPIRL